MKVETKEMLRRFKSLYIYVFAMVLSLGLGFSVFSNGKPIWEPKEKIAKIKPAAKLPKEEHRHLKPVVPEEIPPKETPPEELPPEEAPPKEETPPMEEISPKEERPPKEETEMSVYHALGISREVYAEWKSSIEGLGDSDAEVKEEALAKLKEISKKIGRKVIPFLEKASKGKEIEVKKRILEVIDYVKEHR